ncbi:MAG TPA: sigma-70 family RNA polymerase sigma factor [Anaerolineales bacterium]
MRYILQAGLPRALSTWIPPDDPQFEPLTEDVVQETLLRVVTKLDTFEGRSQFTTWAYKIAVRVALTELRHKKWKNVSLESLTEEDPMDMGPMEPGLMKDSSPGPEAALERQDMLSTVQKMIMSELTERQRKALLAVSMRGMPLEEVALQMGMGRNALYKLLHDARLRLKKRLAKEGLSPQELLKMFE